MCLQRRGTHLEHIC